MGITDEMLMAYADGELSPSEAGAVEHAIAGDAALAARLALFADMRSAVRRAHADPPPVPPALEARVRALADKAADLPRTGAATGRVIALATWRRLVPLWQLPVAAAVALAIGAGSVWLTAPGGGGGSGAVRVAAPGGAAISRALDTVASGGRNQLPDGAELEVVATFRDGDGTLCREFEHDRPGAGGAVVAIACREGDAWAIRLAVATAAPDADAFVPASSSEALNAYLSATGAGAPLSPDDEAAALLARD